MGMRILRAYITARLDRWRARRIERGPLTQEQLALLMRERWTRPRGYWVTQAADRVKARAFQARAAQWFVLHHRVRHQGIGSTATPATAAGRRWSCSPMRRSA